MRVTRLPVRLTAAVVSTAGLFGICSAPASAYTDGVISRFAGTGTQGVITPGTATASASSHRFAGLLARCSLGLLDRRFGLGWEAACGTRSRFDGRNLGS